MKKSKPYTTPEHMKMEDPDAIKFLEKRNWSDKEKTDAFDHIVDFLPGCLMDPKEELKTFKNACDIAVWARSAMDRCS
jgi:hypothetical protein